MTDRIAGVLDNVEHLRKEKLSWTQIYNSVHEVIEHNHKQFTSYYTNSAYPQTEKILSKWKVKFHDYLQIMS